MDDYRVLSAPGAPFFASLPPAQAAALRGLFLAIAGAAVAAAVVYVESGEFGAIEPAITGIVLFFLRVIEGWIDSRSVKE